MTYKDPEAQKRAKREWARKRRGKVPQGSTDVEPEGSTNVEPAEPFVEPTLNDVEPRVEPWLRVMEHIAIINSELADLKSRLLALESLPAEVQGIGEKLADVLATIDAGDVFIRSRATPGGHRKVAQPVGEGAFSKSRQAEGRMGR